MLVHQSLSVIDLFILFSIDSVFMMASFCKNYATQKDEFSWVFLKKDIGERLYDALKLRLK